MLALSPAEDATPIAPAPPPVVSENLLLDRLDAGDRGALLRAMRTVELVKGHVLIDAGETVSQVYFPRRGAISLVLMLSEGAQVETMMVGREGVSCPDAHLGTRRSPVRAVVQLPGEAWRLEAVRLRELAAASPRLRAVLDVNAQRASDNLAQNTACNAAHRLEKRLAKWLLRSLDRADSAVLPLTQEFLAQMLGVQRTTVTEVARVLSRGGAIEYRRGRIVVADRVALERLSCECYAAGERRC